MLSPLEASHPADKLFKTPVPSLSHRAATQPGWGCSISDQGKGDPKAAASAFASPWCPQVCCRRRERTRSAGEGDGILQRGGGCLWSSCGGSRDNTAAFQTWQRMARGEGEQHQQTNPGRLSRAGFGLSPHACLELRHLGMMEPGRADLFLLERATRGLRKEFAPLGAWSWRQKDPGAAELHI